MPEWFITWGDLMALLLCFFVLLQVFSEVKKDDDYVKVVGGIREAFGYSGGVDRSRIDGDDFGAIIELFGGTAEKDFDTLNDVIRASRTTEGLQFTVGGSEGFPAESAEISPVMRDQLEKLADVLAGRQNRIIIRGHSANQFLSPGSPWRDLTDLSYGRARAVLDVLVEEGIDESCCRIEAAGRWQPVDDQVGRAAANRRVDIIVSEELAHDHER